MQLSAPIPAARLRAWSGREDGSMTIFAMFAFVTMLFVAGIAVDMARVEHERVRMQGASDRAALAATALRENISGATAVQLAQAFMEAEGLGPHLGGGIDVEVSANGRGRRVTVTPAAALPTSFMRMLGFDSMPIFVSAQAIEALAPVRLEIVMVLDISGSMNWGNRIGLMREAGVELIEALLRGTQPGQVALTMVPYETEVLPPPGLINHMPNRPVSNAACIDFTEWRNVRASLRANVRARNCPIDMSRVVRPFMHDADEAVAYMRGLRADTGATSIDLGVRFGAMFLDPDLRPATDQMVANRQVHQAFRNLPSGPEQTDVVRVMIVLTDGENCCDHIGRNSNMTIQDQNTLSVCAALRDDGVTIYTIAFEAPARGVALMRACASSPNHFFNTSGRGVIDSFRGISTHIQTTALRLTQ
jgi:Flp pilus assembly protein TadG